MAQVQVTTISTGYLQMHEQSIQLDTPLVPSGPEPMECYSQKELELNSLLMATKVTLTKSFRDPFRVSEDDQKEILPSNLVITASGRHPWAPEVISTPEGKGTSAQTLTPTNYWLTLRDTLEFAKHPQTEAELEWEENLTRVDLPVLRASRMTHKSLREAKPSLAINIASWSLNHSHQEAS